MRFTKRTFYAAGVFMALAVVACNSTLPYRDDVGFLVSAQANSPEFPVYINGKLCTDMEGEVGLCSKRIRSNEDIVFRFDPQTYPWTMTVNCTAGISRPDPASVAAGDGYSFRIKSTDFKDFRSFTCIGEVSPQDRDSPVSARWRVTVVVTDSEYTAREAIYTTVRSGKRYVVLGQYARSAWVKDANGWRQHSGETYVQVAGDVSKLKAYSESYAMRYNYLNMGVEDGGVEAEHGPTL